MEGGRIIIDGTTNQLLSDGRVKSAYLGEKTT
jgi:ABC-type branched-subunit amino acid transport system ATPase component